ncbi:MAG: HEAT repeat domain-containing protein [Candidatus Brocadiia bacterium]
MRNYALLVLVLACFIFVLPWEQNSEAWCPNPPKTMGSEAAPPSVNPTPVLVSRPALSIGLMPRIQAMRTPVGPTLDGVAETWEVWWTLNRDKFFSFKQPIEWVSIKKTDGGTTSITKHPIYEELLKLLRTALTEKDQTVAWNAALALGRSGEPTVLPDLQKAFKENKQILVKDYSILGQGWLRSNEALEMLKSVALDNKEQEVLRSHAVAALGYLSDPAVFGILKSIIEDKENKKFTDLRAAAAIAMGFTKDKDAVTTLAGLLNSAEKVNPKIRSYAAMGLGRIGNEGAFNELKKVMADRDNSVRVSAAIALGMMSVGPVGSANEPKKIQDELISLLKDKQGIIRGLAAISLAQITVKNKEVMDTKTIVPALSKALKDTKTADGDGLIVLAMGILGDESYKAEFKSIMEDRKKRQLLKAAVVMATGLMKDKSQAPTFIAMLKKQSDDPIMSPYLIMSLGMIGDEKALEAIEPIWAKVDKNVTSLAYTNMAVAMSMLGKRSEIVAQLIQHTKSNNDALKQYACHTLGMLGDRDSAKTFVENYNSEKSDTNKAFIITGIGFLMEKASSPIVAEWTGNNNTEISTLIIDHLLPLPTW